LIPQLGEECRRSGPVGQCAQRPQRFLVPTRQASDHVVGIDPHSFELCDELADYFRVRHRTLHWSKRRRRISPRATNVALALPLETP
jgi:hypothetical protein